MSAVLHRAVRLLQQGQAQQAEAELSAHLAANAQDIEALHLRGMARGKVGRIEEGARDLEQAAQTHPHKHAVLNNLGNLYRRAGRLEAAAEAYERATGAAPEFLDASYNLGLTLADLERLDEAEATLKSVLLRQAKHAPSLNVLGTIHARREALDQARACFDQALDAEPDMAIARVNRACLFKTLGLFEASRADFERALALAPNLAEAHFQYASLLRTCADIEGARLAYVNALRLAPMRADIHKDYASLRWELGEGEAATDQLDAVLAQAPDAGLFVARAEIQMRTGRAEQAEISAGQAVAADASLARARALRGELRFRLGRHEDGLADLREAHRLSAGQDFAGRHQLVEALLLEEGLEEANQLLDIEPPAPHLQKHIALKSLAWRLSGDDRYKQFYDYDRFTQKRFIETPPGYASLDAFNAALAEEIRALHATEAQPIDQTLFGGTQSAGRLWDEDNPVISALSQALLGAADAFVAGLPDDAAHPFLRRKSPDLKLTGAWSVRLRSGGGHVDHVHPAGWISACYYVAVPESVMAGERAGWLRLGASGVVGLDLAAERYVKPEPGAVIFFPSYMWHGVEAFESDEVRVTAPFDLLPA